MMQHARTAVWVLAAVTMLGASNAAGADDWDDDWGDEPEVPPVEIHGFGEGAVGSRLVDDPNVPRDFVLSEARFRLDLSHYNGNSRASFKGDFLRDAVLDETEVDIRGAWLTFRPVPWMDAKVGRQVLTWGTGDLVFLNDLFPKDFQSFFIGRDDEFLKAPSNSIKLSAYSSTVNADFVWTPSFTPDAVITGERLSYYNPSADALVGSDSVLAYAEPEQRFKNGEFAARLYRRVGSAELAAYGYWGFTKQPRAFDPELMSPTFAELAAVGASLRGNFLGGLYNLETAYHISREDTDGTDPMIPNSQIRAVAGLEREIAANLTLGLQAYAEWMQDYDAFLESAPGSRTEEVRDMVTARLTYRAMQQTLTASLFVFASAGDGDTHWRPSITRQLNDAVQVTAGANIMTGPKHTFFGQLKDNTNGYLRVRYAF